MDMPKYILSYDLHKVREYAELTKLLQSWGATRALASVWLVDVNLTVAQVRGSAESKMDADDSVVVIELKPGSNWATRNANAATTWLQKHIAA